MGMFRGVVLTGSCSQPFRPPEEGSTMKRIARDVRPTTTSGTVNLLLIPEASFKTMCLVIF